MNLRLLLISLNLCFLGLFSEISVAQDRFKSYNPTWESLQSHEVPEWF